MQWADRSLWPAFGRTPAAVRGSEPWAAHSEPRAKRAEGPRERAVFHIASQAARSAARASGCSGVGIAASAPSEPPRGPTGKPAWRRRRTKRQWRNRSLWPPFWRTPAPVRGSEPWVAHSEAREKRASLSEPRVKRAEGPRERAVFCIASKAARSVAGTSGPIAAAAAVSPAADGLCGATHGPLTLAAVLANAGRRSRL
jgi:hypothetical protein